MKVPFTIYADFESIIVPVQSCSTGDNVPIGVQIPSSSRQATYISPVSSTTYEAMHVPSGFCYVIVDHERRLFKPPVVYRVKTRYMYCYHD